ncbi:hypothetical protein ACSS6W_005947 [Trichoderma asperelloides]
MSAENRIGYKWDAIEHSSLAKGLGILGFHPAQIRKVTCDDSMRIDTALLRSAIEHDKALGKIPFLIVGNAGTTNTGTVDPFVELAAIAREQNLWLHADGAYGASALLCQSRRAILRCIELGDGLSWDGYSKLMAAAWFSYDIASFLPKALGQLQNILRTPPKQPSRFQISGITGQNLRARQEQ